MDTTQTPVSTTDTAYIQGHRDGFRDAYSIAFKEGFREAQRESYRVEREAQRAQKGERERRPRRERAQKGERHTEGAPVTFVGTLTHLESMRAEAKAYTEGESTRERRTDSQIEDSVRERDERESETPDTEGETQTEGESDTDRPMETIGGAEDSRLEYQLSMIADIESDTSLTEGERETAIESFKDNERERAQIIQNMNRPYNEGERERALVLLIESGEPECKVVKRYVKELEGIQRAKQERRDTEDLTLKGETQTTVKKVRGPYKKKGAPDTEVKGETQTQTEHEGPRRETLEALESTDSLMPLERADLESMRAGDVTVPKQSKRPIKAYADTATERTDTDRFTAAIDRAREARERAMEGTQA